MARDVIEGDAVEITDEGQHLPVAVAPTPTTLFRTDDPNEIVQRATDVANVLARVLKEKGLTTTISNREHVRVEGWTFCGTMLGVFPVVEWTRPIENGWEARVEARTLSGAVVGAAEAECLHTESRWKNRDDYAIRSMAQTRAMSKALRGPLGFVVSLAGFDPTPSEEMDSGATEPSSPAGRGGRPPAADRPFAPERDLPPGFAGPNLAQRLAEAMHAIDSTVDWRATWDTAILGVYNKPRAELDGFTSKQAWTRLANVITKLIADGDFPPPSDSQIEAAFAEMFEGVVVEVVRIPPEEPAPLDGVDVPEIDEDLPFGSEDNHAA